MNILKSNLKPPVLVPVLVLLLILAWTCAPQVARETVPVPPEAASPAVPETIPGIQEASRRLPVPPRAQILPRDVSAHGDPRQDEYYWLRERENPQVNAYLEAENAYTEAMTKHTADLQQTLYQEMKGRIKETDLSVPVKKGEFYYYTRTEEGRQYRIYCRKHIGLDSTEQILLDVNQLAAGKKFMRIGVYEVSPDHRYLAFSTDTSGTERYTIQVKDLVRGEMLPDRVPNTSYSLEWANDNRTFFYTTRDHANRPYKLFRHRLGTDPAGDPLVYHEQDEAYFLYITKSRSQDYLFLVLESAVTSEVRFLEAGTPEGTFAMIHPRQQNMEYAVAHHGDRFYIRTNEEAINFKLMSAPVPDPRHENWTEVIGPRDQVVLDQVEVFQDYLVVVERERGQRQLRVRNLGSGEEHYVDFPEQLYSVYLTDNPEFHTDLLRYSYTSLVTSRSIYDYNLTTRTRELKKQEEVLGGYDPSRYTTEQITSTASDGQLIPISLVYRKDLVKDGSNPCYLNGYGAYGSTIYPGFSSQRFSLIDRGFIYAIAHVRGGGYLGRQWYEDGKYLKKKNSFTDFIACAEHLIQAGYTNPGQLVAGGGSAGGLLMGAVMNMRPDLFLAVVAHVPFVDVINTMLDESIPLTVTEYEEWGDPHDPEFYAYMRSYSPYDNVESKDYPHLLITAGLNDTRVQYWEPAKWTARLRALKTDHNRLLLKTNMGAGHAGASGRYDYLKEVAFDYAFILDLLESSPEGTPVEP